MDLGLQNKVAFITGGAGGIGLEIAHKLGEEGCRLAICDLNEDMLIKSQRLLETQGFETYYRKADVTDEQAFMAAAEDTFTRYGQIDLWINNVGMQIHKTLNSFSVVEWNKIWNVNVTSVFLGCRIAGKYLKEGGVILNASSIQGIIPSAGSGPYSATKAAINSLTKTFAAEYGRDGIRVLAYAPSAVRTPMLENDKNIALQGDLYATLPCNRLAEPSDIANLVTFLCSEKASYINGVVVDINGGKFCVQNPRFSYEFSE